MKKSILLACVLLLGACSEMSAFTGNTATTADSSSMAKMRTCLTAEAGSRYQAGTLFTNSIKETASDLVKTCTKKLALESVGISAESQSTAESIISNLKTLATAQ